MTKLKQAMSPDYLKNIMLHPNEKHAKEQYVSNSGYAFDKTDAGRQLIMKEDEMAHLDGQMSDAQSVVERITKQRDSTKRTIKLPPKLTQDDGTPVTWSFYDKFMFGLLLIEIPIILFAGAANVYGNLMASGEPVFLDNPSLAIALSLIVPAGATALKFVTNLLDYNSSKKRYSTFIYILTGIVLIAWTIEFSINFSGIAGSFSIDDMTEDSASGAMLVWLQLFGEMLIGAALVLSAEDIYHKYHPSGEDINPDYRQCIKSLNEAQSAFEAIHKKRASLFGDIAQLSAERNQVLSQAEAEFTASRSRFNRLNTL